MQLKIYFAIILNFMIFCWAENCSENPVILDEHFVACCRGRPKYTSETCIDALLANDTFSQECLLNCMYREFEIYDGNEINLVAVEKFLDEQITDEELHLMYKNAFERCSQLDKQTILEKFNFIGLNIKHECDEYPEFIDICVWYHTLANCPENYATNDETCNNKGKWVNECLLPS